MFSFYRPGQKGWRWSTPPTSRVRDQGADMLANGYADDFYDAFWDAGAMMRRQRLAARPPAAAVDLLARDLLAAPLSPATRAGGARLPRSAR